MSPSILTIRVAGLRSRLPYLLDDDSYRFGLSSRLVGVMLVEGALAGVRFLALVAQTVACWPVTTACSEQTRA